MLRPAATGLFGKIPARADFVRVRAGAPAARALVEWMEEGSEAATRAGESAGAEPVSFLFSPPGAAQVLVGVLAGSADQVGRRFPLAVFAGHDARGLSAGFPAISLAARPFLAAGASFLGAAGRSTAHDLAARIDALPQGEDGALGRALDALRGSASGAPVRGAASRLFGDLAAGQHWYALHAFRCACDPLRGRDPAGAGVVLDCPARDDLDRFAWLDVARRLLAWTRPPSFFWRDDAPGRLLIALGAPPAALFAALWDPTHRDARIWPLTTPKPEAIAAARRALGPAVLGVFERQGASVLDLLATFDP